MVTTLCLDIALGQVLTGRPLHEYLGKLPDPLQNIENIAFGLGYVCLVLNPFHRYSKPELPPDPSQTGEFQ